jgi:DHA3 family macrolide efflux protein-like MFS transporter
MLILGALRDFRIRRLWLGQVGSSVGDELYRMAFIWVAVELLGADTGYAAAVQMAAVLVFGIFFGGLGDRFRPDRVMISVDLIRAALSLFPALLYLFGKPSYPLLLASTVFMGALGTYFDPAMQSSLPLLVRDTRRLRGANGLMGTTYRLARVLGPGLIALLSAWVPIYHFFTINALSYLFSASSIHSLSPQYPSAPSEPPARKAPWPVLRESLAWIREEGAIHRGFWFKCFCGGVWAAVYLVGFALLAHRFEAQGAGTSGLGAYGWIMGAYGVGNLVSVLVFGSLERRSSEGWIYFGFLLIGISFVGMAQARTLPELCFFSAIGAVGGPVNDLPFLEMLQARFPPSKLNRLVRLRIIAETFFNLVFALLSPFLFRWAGVPGSIAGAGWLCVGLSVVFYLRSRSAPG